MTSEAIIDNLAGGLQTGPLFTATGKVNGTICRGDGDTTTRERDSRKEDVLLVWTAGGNAQVAEGFVTVNVFVPDIRRRDGSTAADITRLTAVAALVETAINALPMHPVRYTIDETIHTVADRDTGQHFVATKLRYKHLNI